jgi:hypothetical protein
MIETKTKTCARCDREFDIDAAYRTLYIQDHPHPDDFEAGSVLEDQSYTLCHSCANLIPSFLDDETDTQEQPNDELRKVLNGECDLEK